MLGRVAVRVPARLPRSVLQAQHGLSRLLPRVLPVRPYATPGRPKTVVGEPSRPVKRSVKSAAARPRDGSTAAGKKRAAKKQAPRAMTPRQKAAADAREEADRKRLAKQKAAAHAKKEAAKKRLAECKARERASTKAAAAKRKLADLKLAALNPPKLSPRLSAFSMFFGENAKIAKADPATIGEFGEGLSAKWKTMSAADREHYYHLAHAKRDERKAAFQRWLESHAPAEIRKANAARRQLQRQEGKSGKWSRIPDERIPKRPASPFAAFVAHRQLSGDFRGRPIRESTRLISQEWKALSWSEKEKYEKDSSEGWQRWVSDYRSALAKPASVSHPAALA